MSEFTYRPMAEVGVAQLFGGTRALRHRMTDALDAHEMLTDGIPAAAFMHLISRLATIQKSPSFERAVGMSLRTMQRHREAPDKPLNQEQSGRAWKFAEILARATALLGSQAEAELWLERPAMGLDQRRPIDLLATSAGVGIVETFLGRLEYGVYA